MIEYEFTNLSVIRDQQAELAVFHSRFSQLPTANMGVVIWAKRREA